MKGKILIAVPTFENIKPECFKAIFDLTNPAGYNLYPSMRLSTLSR